MGNNANSTYHAMQVEFEKRFGHGWVYQGNYTWSKAMGENELGTTQYYDNTYRNPKNRSFDKRIMTFSRTHVFKSNGIWELPVGRGRSLLRGHESRGRWRARRVEVERHSDHDVRAVRSP